MTPDQIRNLPPKDEIFSIEQAVVLFLREIAAQLAELNVQLKWFAENWDSGR